MTARSPGTSFGVGGWAGAVLGGQLAFWSAVHAVAMVGSGWVAPRSSHRRFGALWGRSLGPDGDAVVLLHGLISTGDVFGATFEQLATDRRLVIPDLLGFGRSLDEHRSTFGRDAHLDALDEMAECSGLFDCPRWTLGAHSMGVSLALRWAIRHPDHIVRVVGWGAPIYPSPSVARQQIAGSAMTKLFALDTQVAERACAVSCRHRAAAGWLSAVAAPRLPVAIARQVPLHTWPAYRDAVRHLVIDVDWDELVTACTNLEIDVRFVWGADDRVGDRRHAERLVRDRAGQVDVLDHGDHRLPLTDPGTCISHLTDRLD